MTDRTAELHRLAAGRRELLRRGRHRFSVERRDLRDRVIASDPGLTQFRLGLRVIVAIGVVLGLERLLALVVGGPATVPMLLGAVTAMVTASGIRENSRRQTLRVAWPTLPAALIGATLSTVTAHLPVLSLSVFVVLSFVAVWVRRFAGVWTTYGLLAWQSYFFILFLDPPLSELPVILGAITLAAITVTALLATVLFEDPAARLRRTVTALRARVRAAISVALDLLDDPHDPGTATLLRSRLVQVSEVALLFDGQLSEARAIPPGVRPATLRRWVVEVEIGIDELVRSVLGIIDDLAVGDPSAGLAPVVGEDDLARTREVLQDLGWGETEAADRAAARLADHPEAAASVRRMAVVARALVATVDRWSSGEVLRGRGDDGAPEDGDADAAEPDDIENDFEPVITLRVGKLPGTQGLAAELVGDDDAPWWSPSRWQLTTRQAIQAALAAGLAILVGHLISPQRYYWAVIAAFITFTGAATASENVRRSIARIVGTAAGLFAAVLLADVTAGRTTPALLILLLALGLAWYFAGLSYGGMMFMMTIALGQLYSLLHTFSDQVLVLRLEETVAGAVIGAAVGLLVLPAGSRRTLRVARRHLLDSLADLLDQCAVQGAGDRVTSPADETWAQVITLDADARQVVLTTRSLIRGRFFGSDRAGLRRRVAVLGAAAATGRRIASMVGSGAPVDAGVARALADLAAECRRLGAVDELAHATSAFDEGIAERVAAQLDPGPDEPLPRTLRRLADTLGLLTPRGRPG